jgi:hypothetical protein
MAGLGSQPTKLTLHVKLTSPKPVNSSNQFSLGHSNSAAASSGQIVTDSAGTISWPFLDGTRVASADSSTEALCGSTMFRMPGLRQTKSAVPVTVNKGFAFVLPTPPSVVPVL